MNTKTRTNESDRDLQPGGQNLPICFRCDWTLHWDFKAKRWCCWDCDDVGDFKTDYTPLPINNFREMTEYEPAGEDDYASPYAVRTGYNEETEEFTSETYDRVRVSPYYGERYEE